MLLHGQFQPLQRIQPQLSRFFREEYLRGQEPTERNVRVSGPSSPSAGVPQLSCFLQPLAPVCRARARLTC